MTSTPSRQAAAQVARDAYGRLVAILARRSGDLANAEDALSEAFARALERWPQTGIPDNPQAWLLTVARRALLDRARKTAVRLRAMPDLVVLADTLSAGPQVQAIWPDERLGLMLACAHRDIDPTVHAPLMLQAVLGLDAARIASAFLVKPATMGQRLSRAKTRIREAGLAFERLAPNALPDRIEPVLSAIYAAYSTGWEEPVGDHGAGGLAPDAHALARIVADLAPQIGEAHGLLALIAHCQARQPARRATSGRFIPLSDQDCALWDAVRIEAAETALRSALKFGPPGRFTLEAAIQSVHAERRLTGRTNWAAAAALYDRLLETGKAGLGAGVARASAHGEAFGARAALALLNGLRDRGASYQPFHAAQAHWLARDARLDEARSAYDRAIALSTEESVRAFLMERKAAL